MPGESVQIMLEPWGPLVSAELRTELEAEGLEVDEVQRLTESRGLPPWADSPVEVLAIVTLLKEGTSGGRLLATKVNSALRRWQERRKAGTPRRVSKVLGPDGEPLTVEEEPD